MKYIIDLSGFSHEEKASLISLFEKNDFGNTVLFLHLVYNASALRFKGKEFQGHSDVNYYKKTNPDFTAKIYTADNYKYLFNDK
jgi:hypothetical protein